MKISIILAHPDPKSFNHAIAQRCTTVLREKQKGEAKMKTVGEIILEAIKRLDAQVVVSGKTFDESAERSLVSQQS